MDIKKIQAADEQFVNQRNWQQYQTPKNVAICLSVEASELLEIFMWDEGEASFKLNENRLNHLKEEMGDVMVSLARLAKMFDIDLEQASLEKIKKNNEKYPVEKTKGKWVEKFKHNY